MLIVEMLTMNKPKFILYWPNVIEVWQGEVLLYRGTEFKLAQLATVPF